MITLTRFPTYLANHRNLFSRRLGVILAQALFRFERLERAVELVGVRAQLFFASRSIVGDNTRFVELLVERAHSLLGAIALIFELLGLRQRIDKLTLERVTCLVDRRTLPL